MKPSILLNILLKIFIAVIAIAVQSCSDRQFDAVPDYTVSGEPVRLEVPVMTPKMGTATRGDLGENQLNRVESLWIRTYNAETGLATSKWIKIEPKTTDIHNMRTVEIDTQSGHSYIIGVANVDCEGVTSDDIDNVRKLSDLLEEADTWEKFLKIAVLTPSDPDDVNAPQTIPMAGCYSDLITEGEKTIEPMAYYEWQKKDFQPCFIPASSDKVEFKGGIHLRRLVSHITFNFKSGNPDMTLEVNSYRVVNAPRFSWLYERSSEDTTLPNFGDKATSAQDAPEYYADVPQFGSQFIKNSTVNGEEIQSFDFWQAENKHEGNCTKYSDRDAKTEKDGITLFTSLTGDTWTPNNEASYVMVDCTMDYSKSLFVDQDGNKVDPGTPGGESVTRSGNATYFIHLGYIMGDTPDEKSKDFNCFRNVDYTYNVTVNGIDDIRVDAIADKEEFHGEEGLVVDLLDNAIDLDAHYAVFNIKLTEDELKENFGFIITTYDNGEQITLSEKNPRDVVNNTTVIYADTEKKQPIDPKYYNWIELRPTSGENVLAEYKPRFGQNADRKTFLLTDMYNIKDQNGNNMLIMPEDGKSADGYYTVFVNEYTYEPMYGEDGYGDERTTMLHGKPAWMSYVNQNPRRFYIKVSYRESPDGNSVYARSKYAVEQQSLMTYYSQINVDDKGTAVAVERENETLGLNLRHAQNAGGSSLTNGRWNAAQYLTTGAYDHHNIQEEYDNGWGSISVGRPVEKDRSSWEFFLVMNEPLEVPGIDASRLQGGPEIKARTIANGNPHKLRKIKRAGWWKSNDERDPDGTPSQPNFTDPQGNSEYTIKALSAFVNRNRDNNGNGKIEAEELRWYIPAITRYVGMTLGENAMPQRLMDFEEIKQLPYIYDNTFYMPTNENDIKGEIKNPFYTRYMYLASNYTPNASDNNVLWALEGTSLSQYQSVKNWSVGDKSNLSINPWQIRCVRNLGSDLTTVKFDDKVSMPFIHDAASRTLNMKYFNLAAIRTTMLTGNGKGNSNFMPVETINSSFNSTYAGFEYAEDDLTYDKPDNANENNFYTFIENYINKNPCSVKGYGWRLPNQIELTMLYLSGVLENKSTSWLSSTVQYINTKGQGNNSTKDKLFLGSVHNHTLLLTWSNYQERNILVRCVRDVNP